MPVLSWDVMEGPKIKSLLFCIGVCASDIREETEFLYMILGPVMEMTMIRCGGATHTVLRLSVSMWLVDVQHRKG